MIWGVCLQFYSSQMFYTSGFYNCVYQLSVATLLNLNTCTMITIIFICIKKTYGIQHFEADY